jgi:hypothetical protein
MGNNGLVRRSVRFKVIESLKTLRGLVYLIYTEQLIKV